MLTVLPDDVLYYIMTFEDIKTLTRQSVCNKYINRLFSIHRHKLCNSIIKKKVNFIETSTSYNFCGVNHTVSVSKHSKSSLIKAMNLSNLFQ